MSVAAVLLPVADVIVRLADKTPDDEDVKAGPIALVVFLLLIAALVLLGFSLVKQLRKAQAAKDAGVFGDDDDDPSESADKPENHSAS